MIKIRYTASDSVAMADANVKLFVSELIARNARGENCDDVKVSNESVIYEFRIRIALGELSPAEFELQLEKDGEYQTLQIDKRGQQYGHWPVGFCNFQENQALELLGAMLKAMP